MDKPIYEDNPWPYWGIPVWNLGWDKYWKIQWRNSAWSMTILPVWLVIFIAGMIIAFTQIEQEWVFLPIMWTTLFIMMIIGFALMPTRYQIFTDRIRIVLGWVLHFDIPFNNIENITAATRKNLGVLNLNFINSFSGDDIMQIVRKRGAKVHITPWDRTPFLENLSKAMDEWKRYHIDV